MTAGVADEEAESIIEAGEQFGRRKMRKVCGRELDRQWHPVESPAEIGRGVELLWCKLEVVRGFGRSSDEQRQSALIVEAGDAVRLLTGDVERLAARGEHAAGRACRKHLAHEGSGFIQEVLAVVEHQEHLSVGQELSDGRAGRSGRQ